MYKKITYILFLVFLTTSCQTFDSVKRGLTGEKRQSADEFLVKKKDPLILPPDFENLPTPDERVAVTEELSTFEKTLEETMQETSSSSSSTEESIIKKIRRK